MQGKSAQFLEDIVLFLLPTLPYPVVKNALDPKIVFFRQIDIIRWDIQQVKKIY